MAVETFGCCNSFIECSDALRCVNKNQELARGCMYRENLEAGRIFYGKNRGKNIKLAKQPGVVKLQTKPLSKKITIV